MSIELRDAKDLLSKARPDLKPLIDRTWTLRELTLVVEATTLIPLKTVAPPVFIPTFTLPLSAIKPSTTTISSGNLHRSYTLRLDRVGSNVIGAIKSVRNLTNMGLKEAKDVVDRVRGTYGLYSGTDTPGLGVPQELGIYSETIATNFSRELQILGCDVTLNPIP